MRTKPQHGAMVISLDFELSWGVRDFLEVNPAYAANIEGEGKAENPLNVSRLDAADQVNS